MREKKKQRVVYDPEKAMINRPASWKRSASGNLCELRKSMLSRSRLPRGIVTGAEAKINVKAGEIDASLLPLLRSDLPADIQDTFLKTIEEAAVSDSDYIASYSVQVYKLVLLLKKSSFFKLDNDEIILQHKVSVSIQDIIPESFCCQSDIIHFSPPIDRSCLTDDALKKEFSSLFNPSHLQVIHASYFGIQDVTKETLKSHSFQTALRQALNKVNIIRRKLAFFCFKKLLHPKRSKADKNGRINLKMFIYPLSIHCFNKLSVSLGSLKLALNRNLSDLPIWAWIDESSGDSNNGHSIEDKFKLMECDTKCSSEEMNHYHQASYSIFLKRHVFCVQ
ncbi:hypothetical protein BCV71DRAFT_236791 [Rhizopus microsporus]|uniref:Uncharacterized protein n=1 Tax=Rhizopus microsporus TaxID=58291 RepID=A0A1X0RW92_RHIZD|nr:hypothetical protein BCV71DRAFT_236791 [Rhizopus microsporus]